MRFVALVGLSMLLFFRTMWGPWLDREAALRNLETLSAENHNTQARIDELQHTLRIWRGKNAEAKRHLLRDELGWTDPTKHEIILTVRENSD